MFPFMGVCVCEREINAFIVDVCYSFCVKFFPVTALHFCGAIVEECDVPKS